MSAGATTPNNKHKLNCINNLFNVIVNMKMFMKYLQVRLTYFHMVT